MQVSERNSRNGRILRTLPHGTVIIWDIAKRRSYPFYRAGAEVFRARQAVEFITDKTDTFVVKIVRSSGSGRRKATRPSVYDREVVQRRAG